MKIDYMMIKDIENFINRYNDNEIIVGLLSNKIVSIMESKGYLKRIETKHNHSMYRGTSKLSNSLDFIFEDLFNITIDEFKKQNIISSEKIPADYESLFESLVASDGFFNGVSFDDELKEILAIHEFVDLCGPNGVHACGTDKLRDYYENDREEEIISIITGKDYA
jgi:hypothetical protein